MKKSVLLISAMLYTLGLFAEITPLSLQSRVEESQYLVLGKVVNTVSYWDQDHKNIYTLHDIEIDGYWKGQNSRKHIALVDLGGQVGNFIQNTFPSVHLGIGDYGVFMLNGQIDENLRHPNYKVNGKDIMQCFPTASIQGVLLNKMGKWQDVASPEKAYTQSELFSQIEKFTDYILTISDGEQSKLLNANFSQNLQTSNKPLAVSSLQNGSLVTTTIFSSGVSNNAVYEMIINGSGFGTTTGTIQFPDADQGGGVNKFTFPSTVPGNQSSFGAPSDVISWTNTQIRIRVPRNAGTGVMEVFNSSNVSQGTSSITIDWTILPVYTNFGGFAATTSQFNRLINDDGNGGYNFQMSSAGSANFFTNASAKLAFKKAVDSWRCNTFVPFNLDLTTPTTTAFGDDGTNVVIFDNSLPSGVLGRATTRTTASFTGLCNMHNTFMRIYEIDVQFPTIPVTGTTWNYNSSGTTISQFNFESVALHEMGHGHSLGHVVNNGQVMHYTLSNGTQNVTLATSDIAAGNYVISKSIGPNCITTPGPLVPLTNPTACTPLPIDLLSFTGSKLPQDNQLNWVTANEESITDYHLEYSYDGISFMELATLSAKLGKDENHYEYIHSKPSSNILYYRLKINDIEGKTSYSPTVTIVRDDVSGYTAYPNPASDYLNILEARGRNTSIRYSIQNTTGQTIHSGKVTLDNGTAFLNVGFLAKGLYFLNLQDEKEIYLIPFSKQ